MTSLSISRLINVAVTLTALPAQSQNLSTLLILGDSTVIDLTQRIRSYIGIDEVAAEFGTTAPEYLAAALWFEQAPQPSALLIGRWAKTAAAGQLIGGTLSAANQLIATWNAIANGSFSITVDGGAPVNIAALNFAAAANLNAVAAIIDAALGTADCAYDSNFQRFVFTSHTTGAASTVAFLGSTGGGTDIKAMLAGTAATNAYRADGIAPEAPDAAVAIFDSRFGQQWYAVTVLDTDNAGVLAVAAYVEASTTKHAQGVTTQDIGVLSSVNTTNIAYLLKQLGYKKTFVQYSSSNACAVCSLLGRILTTDYTGQNTTITLMYKNEPGIVAEQLNSSQVAALESFNCNVFVAYNNNTAIIEPGVASSGDFIDTVIIADAFAVDLMTALYNVLYTSPNKIPQTDAGMHVLGTTIEGICIQYVDNGAFGPGQWNSAGFGTLKQGDFLGRGYYVYTPPVSLQSQSRRAARRSVPFQVAAKLAGAVHFADVLVTLNQ